MAWTPLHVTESHSHNPSAQAWGAGQPRRMQFTLQRGIVVATVASLPVAALWVSLARATRPEGRVTPRILVPSATPRPCSSYSASRPRLPTPRKPSFASMPPLYRPTFGSAPR